MNEYTFIIMNFTIFLLTGLLYVFMPFLTRKTESFGVSITEEVYFSEKMKKIRKRYLISSMSVLIITFLLTLTLFLSFPEPQNIYIYVSGIFIMLLLMFLTYLYFHFLIKKMKIKEKWTAEKKQVSLIDTSFRQRKLTYSNTFFLVAASIIVFSVFFTIQNYQRIPDLLPMQYDFSGNPTLLKEKSILSVFWPNIMQVLMLGLFIFINNIIAAAKQQIDPRDPENSLKKNEIFRRKWSAFIIATGTLMTILFSFMQITFIFTIPANIIFFFIAGFTGITIIWAVYLSVAVGQGGSRIKISGDLSSNEIDRDQDNYWKLGQFYYNPEDPSIFIEKRFGIGWTINFGNKKGWLYIIVLLIVILLSVYFGN